MVSMRFRLVRRDNSFRKFDLLLQILLAVSIHINCLLMQYVKWTDAQPISVRGKHLYI